MEERAEYIAQYKRAYDLAPTAVDNQDVELLDKCWIEMWSARMSLTVLDCLESTNAQTSSP